MSYGCGVGDNIVHAEHARNQMKFFQSSYQKVHDQILIIKDINTHCYHVRDCEYLRKNLQIPSELICHVPQSYVQTTVQICMYNLHTMRDVICHIRYIYFTTMKGLC